MNEKLLQLDVDALIPDPNQPRQTFIQEEIDRIAASVAARGILQPLRVRPDAERNCWWIIFGECRWRAAKQAGLKTVPCMVVDGELSELDGLIDQITENVVRAALPPTQLSRALAKAKALKNSWRSPVGAR